MNPIRIFTYTDTENGQAFAYTLDWFKQFKLESEEDVTDVYGEAGGQWHSVSLKPMTAATDRDVKRAARIPDSERGFILDETELPAARASLCVAEWSFPQPVTKEGYNALPVAVAALIDANICQRLYGGAADPFFLNYLKNRQPTSEAKPA